ncbi:MAG: ornithine carbamoyltransferase [Mucinivorans sp.]
MFRHLLSISELSATQIEELVSLASELKLEKKEGRERQRLVGRNIVLLFEKDSTRTRCSFEVAAADQGARTTYIGSSGSQMGSKESIADTARVLGRMYDGIEYRGYGQHIVEQLAEYSGVPVWNGLTNETHPTQFLADYLTIKEHYTRRDKPAKVVFMGTGDNNVALSLMVGCAKVGMEYALASPREYFPDSALVDKLRADGAKITLSDDLATALVGADFVYTDVWVSMGEAKEIWAERIAKLMPYQVNAHAMKLTANPDVKFMHCLPAFHNTQTEVGRQIFEQFGISQIEVTDEVFESSASIVFDEAENRMHSIKAVMVASLGR